MPEAAPTQRTDWYGRNRRWLWIGLALGIWAVVLALAYVGFARFVSNDLAEARTDLERALAELPRLDPVASTGATASAGRDESSMDWIARMGSVLPGAIGDRTMPPRVPGGIARTLSLPSEVFLIQPHYGVSSASSAGPQTTAPECSRIPAAILEDDMGLSNWRAEIEDRPARLLTNRACYAVVAGWQDQTESIPPEALEADRLVHTPPEHWFTVLEREGLPAPLPGLCGAVLAARRLADGAVYHAARGETQLARDHLVKALAACDALCGLVWITGFAAWEEAEIQVLERACLCMTLLAPGELPTELDVHLASLAPRERYLAAIRGEVRLIERDFERAKNGLATRVRAEESEGFGAGPLLSLQLDKELADQLRGWLDHLRWAGTAPYSAGPPPVTVRTPMSSTEFDFKLTPPGRGSMHPWGELAALKELVQLARMAARDGVEVAQQAAKAIVDPFSGAPLATRLEPDGTLVFWSVGEDRKNDDAPARLTCDPKPDIVVRVPTR